MVVSLKNTEGIDCTPAKEISPSMVAVSHIGNQRMSYQELKNRKKDPATWSHAISPPFGGSSYPAADIATILSTDGATKALGAAGSFRTWGTLSA